MTMTQTGVNPREAYLAASVSTASPAQLLVMLCERLTLDVQRAAETMRQGTPGEAHAHLLHAQEIVLELNASLRIDAWDGAKGLAALYDFLHQELVRANVEKSLEVTESCLGIVSDLRDTWRDAALQLMTASA
jgi:flagellar protein FliS